MEPTDAIHSIFISIKPASIFRLTFVLKFDKFKAYTQAEEFP